MQRKTFSAVTLFGPLSRVEIHVHGAAKPLPFWALQCVSLLHPHQNPLSFGKKEQGLELQELTSLFHTLLGCLQGWPVSSPDPTVLHKHPQPRGSGDQQLPMGRGVVPTATSKPPRSSAEGLRVILGALRSQEHTQ